MATSIAIEIEPDRVISFEILPGTLDQFRESLGEKGPLIKCFEGSVTLVSPGKTHESWGHRLDRLIFAICLTLRISFASLGSTFHGLPTRQSKTGYEPDESYYIQSFGTTVPGQVPDLAIEIVVTHSEHKAMAAGTALGISELWVLDIPRHQLTFLHLVTRGKDKGGYRTAPRSRAFPFLYASEALERLDDPEADDVVFHENCRAWAETVLRPRYQKPGKPNA